MTDVMYGHHIKSWIIEQVLELAQIPWLMWCMGITLNCGYLSKFSKGISKTRVPWVLTWALVITSPWSTRWYDAKSHSQVVCSREDDVRPLKCSTTLVWMQDSWWKSFTDSMEQLGFAHKNESTELGQSEVSQSQWSSRQWKFLESVTLSFTQ